MGRDGKVVTVNPDISRVKLAQESNGGINNLTKIINLQFPKIEFSKKRFEFFRNG